jgi:site-specific recombinase XerD
MRVCSSTSLDDSEIAFAPFIARLRAQGYAEATIRRDVKCLRRVARWLAGRDRGLSAVQCSELDQVIKQMWRGQSKAWIATVRQSLRHWVDFPQRSRSSSRPRGQWENWVNDYARFLVDHRGLRAETVQDNISDARRFLSAMFGTGTARWQRLRVEDIWRYSERCAHGAKPGYANKRLFALRRFLQYVHGRGICPAQLFHAVPHVASFTTTPAAPVALTRAQQHRLLAAFPRRLPTGRRDRAVALCMLDLGLRSAEVALLRLEDLDLNRKRLAVAQIKGGDGRELPLPRRLAAAIREYLAHRPPSCSDRLFLRPSSLVGQPLSALAVQSAMTRAYRRAGLPQAWHGSPRLRHTFASRLFASGASLKEIADMLGHRRLDSANLYTGVDLASLRKVALPWPS